MDISQNLFEQENLVLENAFKYTLRDIQVTWASTIRQNQYLRFLNLSHCELGDHTCSFIFQGLIQNTCIQHLNLRNNHIEDKSILTQLLVVLVKNKTLEHLDLSFNQISDFSGQKIAQALKHNETLQYLNLENNALKYDAGFQFE